MSPTTPQRRRRQWLALAISFVMVCCLLAVPSASSQEQGKVDAGAALRKDPQYAQLYHDAKAFYALPAATQTTMRQLYEGLEKLAPAEREWLTDTLNRYADWLDKLPEADRQKVVSEPNLQARLQIIKDLRDKQWFARQPKSIRQYLDKLPKTKPLPAVTAASIVGLAVTPPRTMRPLNVTTDAAALMTDWQPEAIKRLKKEEARMARDWVIATRHWSQLTDVNPKNRTMQTRPAEFGLDVETFIREYLMPVLTEEERGRLKAAEGKWPLYPLTLVDLADKHPMALPQPNGPKLMADLPTEVRDKVMQVYAKVNPKEGKKKQDPDKFFHNAKNAFIQGVDERLQGLQKTSQIKDLTTSIKFTSAVATFTHKQGGVKMPHELWPIKASEMSDDMRVFLNQNGPFWGRLSSKERDQLNAAQGKWPEYPLKIQELANKYGFSPPWFSLPMVGNKGDIWDKYRVNPRNKWDQQPVIAPKGKGKGGIGKDKVSGALWLPQPGWRELAPRDIVVQALAWSPIGEPEPAAQARFDFYLACAAGSGPN
ncbi:MAG TPA: hypothetical protein VE988_07580 [Gemmataceae bacterium]|nr:hypothetical protein [Gemmataceae bacterium]